MNRSRPEAGFTMVEVMIAVLLSVIAVIGIIALFMTETKAASYSRRATEATNLAQDKLEYLRTAGTPASSSESSVDAQGACPSGCAVSGSGMFDRKWTVTAGTSYYDIKVQVGWSDDINEATSCSTDAQCTTSHFCRPSNGMCATRAVVVYGRRNN
jgi:Tfp pilus assembly protein PilV